MPRTRKETTAQARKSARESSLSPLYAVAGLTDVLAEGARTRLNERLTETHERAESFQSKAKQNADELAKFIAELPAQLKALPQTTRERAERFSEHASSYRSEASSRYENLAGRGKRRVDEAVSTAQTFGGRVQKETEDGLKDADPVFKTVQEAATQLRKKATGRTATDTVTPKTAATTPSEKTQAKKASPATKSTATKAPAKKSAAKRAPAKKTANA